VREVVDAYLSLTDTAIPAFVQGLYVTGSVALGDFRRAGSDIDFVVVSAVPPSPPVTLRLEQVHARLAQRHPRPFFEGPYVTWDELATDPAQAAPGLYAHRGRLLASVPHGRQPATWQVLARHGIPFRGPSARDLTVDTSPGELRDWARDGVNRYWRPWWERGSRPWSRDGLALLSPGPVAWGVLGASRAHRALTSGEVSSKLDAGLAARAAFDARHHRILEEAVRIRRGGKTTSLYRTPLARRADALAFVGAVLDDATRRGEPA
jgi:Nucleotidyltransferase domain